MLGTEPGTETRQPGRELARMSHAIQDQRFLGRVDRAFPNCLAAVSTGPLLETHLLGESIFQPRLDQGQLPIPLRGAVVDHLSSLRRVLPQQGAHFGFLEIAEPDGFRFDIESTSAAGVVSVLGGEDPVVADIADAAQDHALRETRRAHVVARPQLSQH